MRSRTGLWLAAAVAAFLLTIGIPVGFTIGYVHAQVAHSCQALELLTANPVPKPAAGAPATRVTVYRFYLSLVYWRNADGCRG